MAKLLRFEGFEIELVSNVDQFCSELFKQQQVHTNILLTAMKKVLKFIGYGLLCLVLLLGGFCTYVAAVGVPSYDPPTIPEITVESTPARVTRGEVIAQIQCLACHANNENRVTGKYLAEVPAIFGKLYSKNITQDKEKGIGNWTDGELMYFLRTGLRRDGSYAPVMPQYPHMADEDLKIGHCLAALRPISGSANERRSAQYRTQFRI
jgi:mono/diheme cytochrome c family protein